MIGEKIVERRKLLGLTQQEVADIAQLPQSYIAAFESGAKTDCNVSTARRIARALGCGIDYLASTFAQDAPLPTPLPRRPRGRPRKRPLAEAGVQP